MARLPLSCALTALLLALAACDGCGGPVDPGDDAGSGPSPTDGGGEAPDGGRSEDGGSGVDAGPRDAGNPDSDAGPPPVDGGSFSWEDLFGEAGVPDELACIPGTLPDLGGGVSGILNALNLTTYSGSPETGVVCGDTTCAAGIPCCVLCGYAQCAEPGDDGGPPSCPAFTATFTCDGKEDCGDGDDDTCCFSLSGTQCRPRDECAIDLAFPDGGFPDFSLDGGFSNPFEDAGADPVDAGATDAGESDAGESDAGESDAGETDAGMSPMPADAGQPADLLGPILDQGVRVCHRTLEFLDPTCDLLSGEVCCTSENFVSVDLGLCVPLLLCTGGGF